MGVKVFESMRNRQMYSNSFLPQQNFRQENFRQKNYIQILRLEEIEKLNFYSDTRNRLRANKI